MAGVDLPARWKNPTPTIDPRAAPHKWYSHDQVIFTTANAPAPGSLVVVDPGQGNTFTFWEKKPASFLTTCGTSKSHFSCEICRKTMLRRAEKSERNSSEDATTTRRSLRLFVCLFVCLFFHKKKEKEEEKKTEDNIDSVQRRQGVLVTRY